MADLFANSDLDARAPRGPRLVRLLAGSVALHAAFVFALVYVPAVRDTFRLANTLSGLQLVDEAYTRTDVRERATIIKLDKLYYPPGYFAQGDAPTTAPPDVRLDSEYKPEKPKPTPIPTPTPTPAPTPAQEVAQADATKAGQPGASPEASPSPGASPAVVAAATPADMKTTEDAEKALQETSQQKFPPINTRPFTDLLQKGKEMKDAGQINLSGTLEMAVEADRRDDGTLTNVEVTGGAASDAKLKDLAKAFVAALSDSHALAALQGTRHLRMNLVLDDQKLAVRVMTEVASAEQAQQMARGYQGLLLIGALSKKGRDEEAIFKSIRVTTAEREITLNFNMPRKTAGDLLSKLAKKTEAGPSS
jgi:hypothetical protein